jgi:hypothetical protein
MWYFILPLHFFSLHTGWVLISISFSPRDNHGLGKLAGLVHRLLAGWVWVWNFHPWPNP